MIISSVPIFSVFRVSRVSCFGHSIWRGLLVWPGERKFFCIMRMLGNMRYIILWSLLIGIVYFLKCIYHLILCILGSIIHKLHSLEFGIDHFLTQHNIHLQFSNQDNNRYIDHHNCNPYKVLEPSYIYPTFQKTT